MKIGNLEKHLERCDRKKRKKSRFIAFATRAKKMFKTAERKIIRKPVIAEEEEKG